MTYAHRKADSDSVNLGSNPSSPATKKTKRISGFRASNSTRKIRKSENRQRTHAARKSAQRTGKKSVLKRKEDSARSPHLKPKPYRASRFGIQNHYGEVWTPETFQTQDQAQKYLDKMRPIYGGLTRRHKVVPVRVAISIARSAGRARG